MPNDVSEKREIKSGGSANIVIPFEGENFVGILVDRDRESGGGGGAAGEEDMFALHSTSALPLSGE